MGVLFLILFVLLFQINLFWVRFNGRRMFFFFFLLWGVGGGVLFGGVIFFLVCFRFDFFLG